MLNFLITASIVFMVAFYVIKFIRYVIKVEMSWEYSRVNDDVRRNSYINVVQGYSVELGRWADLEYLRTTTYDNLYWLNNLTKDYFPND